MLAKPPQAGSTLMLALVFMSIFLIMAGGLVSLTNYQQKVNIRRAAQNQALYVAEAGVNYYRWHLAHDADDYADGTGETGCDPCGPYQHDYTDPYGTTIGQYELRITPPEEGSTTVTIESTGWMNEYPKIKRTIRTRYGLRSLAEYSFIFNGQARFSNTSSTQGQVHANQEIRFDGINYNTVSSAEPNNGVYGDPIHPEADPTLWEYPVPAVDFTGLTLDMSQLKTQLDEGEINGVYLEETGGGDYGYHLNFTADGQVYIYVVTKVDKVQGYSPDCSCYVNDGLDIDREVAANPASYSLEDISLIFVEDNIWVDGVLNGRLSVVANNFASPEANIYLSDNLTYLLKDGTNSLGLMAEKNILISRYVPNDLEVDAIMLAQNGRITRYYYENNILNSLTIYGSIITKEGSGFKWVYYDQIISGFVNTYYINDPDVTFTPPPHFPTTGEPEFLFWEELSMGEE